MLRYRITLPFLISDELKAKRVKVTEELQKDLGLLEKAVADRDEHAKDKLVSSVDPDARTGKKTGTNWPGYKAQTLECLASYAYIEVTNHA